jgi:hypothetical protein
MITRIKATRKEWKPHAERLNGMGPDEEQFGRGVRNPMGELKKDGHAVLSNRQVRQNWIRGSHSALVEDRAQAVTVPVPVPISHAVQTCPVIRPVFCTRIARTSTTACS